MATTPSMTPPDESTLGGRIHAIRQARGRGDAPQGLKQFLESMNQHLPQRDRVFKATVVARWELNTARPTFAQAVAIAKLDPLGRGVDWLAGIAPAPETRGRPEDRARPG